MFQPSAVAASEDSVVEISCNHSISQAYSFFWYLHIPGRAPRLLIKGSGPSQQGRYNMTYERFSSSLLIPQVQVADAAIYYCALRGTEAWSLWRAAQKQGGSQPLQEVEKRWAIAALLPKAAFPKHFHLARSESILRADTLNMSKRTRENILLRSESIGMLQICISNSVCDHWNTLDEFLLRSDY